MNTEPIQSSLESIKKEDWDIHVVNYCVDNVNKHVITKSMELLPDVIVYLSVSGGQYLASIETFKTLKDIAPSIHICFDASCPDWHPLLSEYINNECFEVQINIDGNFKWPQGVKDFTTLCPIDHRPYQKVEHSYQRFLSRPVHCGFAGGTGSPDRRAIIDYLQTNNAIKVMPREEVYGSYVRYADFLTQSKLVLNMSRCGSGKARQVKARVIEAALSHSLLLEEKNSTTSTWFKAGEDFLEYETKEEALQLIEGLYDNEASVFTYAENLHRKVIKHYSAERFWSKAFGLAIP